MHLNNNTGALTGTPTAAGRVSVTLQATSIQYNTTATQSFNVTVALASNNNGGDDTGGGGTTGGQTALNLNIPTLWLIVGAALFLLLILVVARRRK
jgi:hypothetical protein